MFCFFLSIKSFTFFRMDESDNKRVLFLLIITYMLPPNLMSRGLVYFAQQINNQHYTKHTGENTLFVTDLSQ